MEYTSSSSPAGDAVCARARVLYVAAAAVQGARSGYAAAQETLRSTMDGGVSLKRCNSERRRHRYGGEDGWAGDKAGSVGVTGHCGR